MMINFKDIGYLEFGNKRQQRAYKELNELKIFTNLKKYKPILIGTIPIEIDTPDSDLDIIFEYENENEFHKEVVKFYGERNNFEIEYQEMNRIKTTFAKFKTKDFDIELFGQNIPTENQHGYQHMLIEYEILKKKDIKFRNELMKLKLKGMKTEPAFAKLLGLKGNPYEALLQIKKDYL